MFSSATKIKSFFSRRSLLLIVIIPVCSCSSNSAGDEYISEDSLRAYAKRDSVLNVLSEKIETAQHANARVDWAGDRNCNYIIIDAKGSFYVARNNLTGGVYTDDRLTGDFIPYGNMEAYDITSGSQLNLFVVQYYSTRQSAVKYIESQCGLGDL